MAQDADLKALAARHDRFDMAATIERMPAQIEFALADPDFPEVPRGPFDAAVVAGMGGSALPADVLAAAFRGRFSAPLYIFRHYRIPIPVGPGTLAVASSFSGNTEETVASLEDAAARGAAAAVVCAGGKLADRIPVIYTDEPHRDAVARIVKIKFNEHAKRPAFYNCFPELNHNEMIGFVLPHARFAVLYLRDPASHERVHRRFEVMQKVFRKRGIDHVDFREWTLPGATELQKIFAAQLLGEWCAYAAALLAGLDPTPVALVEDFKVEMER